MVLCYITSEYPGATPAYGGIGRAFAAEAEWLLAQGIEVLVVVQHPGVEPGDRTVNGVRVRSIPTARIRKASALLDRLSAARYTTRWLRYRHAVVVAADYGAMVQTRLDRHPLVVQLHGCSTVNALQRGERPGRLTRLLERRIVSLADDVRAVAHDTAVRTLEALGLEKRPVRVIPNSVDTEYFNATPVIDDKPQALFVGKLNRTKGAWVVAEFAQQLLERNPELTLVLAGMDSMENHRSVREAMAARVSDEVRGRLVFPGRLSRDQVREAYRRARVVVVPSLSEACPMVVLEAMAMGRPLVASRRGGIPELVEEGANGFLADPGSPLSFVAPIEALLHDRDAAARMGGRGRERAVARYSPDGVMRAVLEGYEAVLHAPRERRAGKQ